METSVVFGARRRPPAPGERGLYRGGPAAQTTEFEPETVTAGASDNRLRKKKHR